MASLALIARHGHPRFAAQIQEPEGATALHTAAYQNSVEVTRILLAANADVNLAKRTGATPLYIAAQENNEKVLLILLEVV